MPRAPGQTIEQRHGVAVRRKLLLPVRSAVRAQDFVTGPVHRGLGRALRLAPQLAALEVAELDVSQLVGQRRLELGGLEAPERPWRRTSRLSKWPSWTCPSSWASAAWSSEGWRLRSAPVVIRSTNFF